MFIFATAGRKAGRLRYGRCVLSIWHVSRAAHCSDGSPFARQYLDGGAIRLSPATVALASAKDWLGKVGATLDGIIAKQRDAAYAAGTRDAMVKIKNYRSADCVIGGFRYGTDSNLVGSL